MESPDIYLLMRHRWQLFGTLTFKSERKPERLRVAMWFSLMRATAKDFSIYFPNLPWCLRMEDGETNGRKHFHYLMTGIPAHAVQESTCFAQMKRWESFGGGMARVRVFDAQQGGTFEYLEKCLDGRETGLTGADQYESSKFGWKSCQLMYSSAVWNPRIQTRIPSDLVLEPGKEEVSYSKSRQPVKSSLQRGNVALIELSKLRSVETAWKLATTKHTLKEWKLTQGN